MRRIYFLIIIRSTQLLSDGKEMAESRPKFRKQEKPPPSHDEHGKFAMGNALGKENKGKPCMSNRNAFMNDLFDAMKVVEKDKKKTLAKHALERAFSSDTVLVALLRKFAPDLAQVKVTPDGEVLVSFNIKDFREDKKKASTSKNEEATGKS